MTRSAKWADRALREEHWKVASPPDSIEPVDVLSDAAFRIGQIVAGGGLDAAWAETALCEGAKLAGVEEDEAHYLIREAFTRAERTPRLPTEPSRSSRLITASNWVGIEPPERSWVIESWIPAGTTTVLYGDGGTGKSLLVQQLATAVAAGVPFLGLEVRPGRAIGLFCEDDAEELHRRQVALNARLGVEMSELDDLQFITNAGQDSTLFAFRGAGEQGKPTEFADRFASMCEDASLIIVDTAADTFGGNEVSRYQVRQFLTWLNKLALDNGAAVILLAHPSLTGMASGRGQSGSTAWTNGARSHLYLEHAAKPDDDPGSVDPAERILSRKKANYAAKDEAIGLAWEAGAFIRSGPAPASTKAPRLTHAQRICLDALRLAVDQGGEPQPLGPDGATVRAVRLGLWRDYSRTAGLGSGGSDDPERRASAFRVAWKACHEALQAKRLVRVWDEFAWLP